MTASHTFRQTNDTSMIKLRIPPPVYTLTFIALMWLTHRHLPVAYWLETPWTTTGLIVMAVALLPAFAAFRLFSRFQTTANPRHPEKAQQLVTAGIFSYSRNPMYLSLLLVLTGWAIHLGSITTLFFPPLFFWLVTTLQIKPEEEILQSVFGPSYERYQQATRRWI